MPRVELNDSDDDAPVQKSAHQPKANHLANNNNNAVGGGSHHDQKKKFFYKEATEEEKERQRELAAKNNKTALKAIETDDGTEMPVRENTKIFVDGLPYQEPANAAATVTDQLIAFCTAWKVGKVVHVSKKPGQGFAYIAFRSPNSVDVAISVLNGKRFMGRTLRVELPKLAKGGAQGGNPNKDLDYDRLPARPASAATLNDAESYTKQVLLSDLPPHAQPDILRELFAQYCPALEPYITKIKMTSRNRKAFVTLDEESQAQELANFLNGFTLLGRRIEASMAQPPGVAQWSPFQVAQQKKEQLLKAVQQEAAEKAKHVPAGWGGAAATSNKNEDAADQQQESRKKPVKISKEEKQELLGDNATKRFPMPVLIGDDDEVAVDRRRGRGEDNNKQSSSSEKPKNSAAASLDSRFNKQGARTIYVANLSDEVSEVRLRKHFAAIGGIIRKCELQNVGGVPNGLATIEYALAADAEAAVKKLDRSILGGQEITVELDGSGKVGTYGNQAEDEDVIEEYKRKEKTLNDDEQDAFARHYGIKDRKKFLATYAKEDEDDEDEGDEDDEDFEDEDDDDDDRKNKKSGSGKKKLSVRKIHSNKKKAENNKNFGGASKRKF